MSKKNSWQLQQAKNKLSEVIDLAQKKGPQSITRHGKETAVLLSFEDYKRLTLKNTSIVDFFKDSPLSENDIELERKKDPPREIDL